MRNKLIKMIMISLVMSLFVGMTVSAEEVEESIEIEQSSFEQDDQWIEIDEPDQYVDGIYNIGENARAAMSGVIRLYQSGTKLCCNYSTVYTYSVNRIGAKNIKLQYKGSLGIWHNIITLDDRYRTNAANFMGSFTCNGVVGRTYRVKGTHYISDDSYSESRDNVTLGLTFE